MPDKIMSRDDLSRPSSPLARRLARENGLDIATMTGSGDNGRVIKRDIAAALENPNFSQSTQLANPAGSILPDPRLFFAQDEYEAQKLSPMMASIAERLQAAKQEIPHYQVSMDIPLDALLDLRTRLNKQLSEVKDAGEKGEKLSLNDFIIRATALALMDVPEINRGWAGDAILHYKNADISVAVALPDGGLVTPIVRAAQNKSVRAIALEIKELSARAGNRRLKPEEYEGGTFSVSNLGMFGVAEFSAIINPPQSAILAIGGSCEKLAMRDGQVVITQEMRVTLSSDHRVINGAQAAQFLGVLRDYLSAPLSLLF